MYCPGEYHLPGQTHKYREGRGGVHGATDLHTAIVRSCDVYFYQLALAIGIDDLANGLKAFGFGVCDGARHRRRESGIVPSPEWKKRRFARREDQVWFPGETINTGVGQGYMLVTPLQLAHAEADNGRARRRTCAAAPDRRRGRRHAQGHVYRADHVPNVEGPTPEHWDFVRDAMVGVTSEARGTARGA